MRRGGTSQQRVSKMPLRGLAVVGSVNGAAWIADVGMVNLRAQVRYA
jgi:hypothetical protein